MPFKPKNMTLTLPGISEMENQRKIAALAYDLWLSKAFRAGAPKKDWLAPEQAIDSLFRAQREVLGRSAAAKLRRQTPGSYLPA